MEQLIWFSVPGAVIVFAFVTTYPDPISAQGAAALGGAIPLIGFLFHQGFRVVFEALGCYENDCRLVISQIADDFELKGENRRRQAFEIWEITFYGEKFPKAFRDHDREAWHYIQSFWSGAFAGVAGLILLFVFQCCFKSHIRLAPLAVAVYIVTAAILAVKGWQTYRSLVRQEVAAYKACYQEFKKVAESRDSYKDRIAVPGDGTAPPS